LIVAPGAVPPDHSVSRIASIPDPFAAFGAPVSGTNVIVTGDAGRSVLNRNVAMSLAAISARPTMAIVTPAPSIGVPVTPDS
jgi:hypothetical protein